MPGATLKEFPFKKARDLRSAMAKELARYLETLAYTFPATRTPRKLAAVYDEWASFEQRALSAGGALPAAAVLPDRALPDADAFVPRLLEETWSGGDPNALDPIGAKQFPIGDGTLDGFGLWAVAEKVVPFLVLVRAASEPQRQAIVSALEDAFVEVPDPGSGKTQVRWGIVTTMPDYYGRAVRFTLKAHQLLDSESTAKENRWMVQVELQAEAKQVLLARVPAMDARVLVVDMDTDDEFGRTLEA